MLKITIQNKFIDITFFKSALPTCYIVRAINKNNANN